MANIFKIKSTKPVPRSAEILTKAGQRFVRFGRHGKQVLRPLTADGTRYREESTKWYVQYKDAEGTWRRVPGYTDKDATRQLAAELERKVERRQSGLSDAFDDHRARRLSDHLADFRRHLEAKANSAKHVDQTCNRIDRVLRGCGFSCWPDISASLLAAWLSDRRIAGEFGVKTSNYYLAAFKEFCTWIVRDGRAATNPLSHVTALNAELDVRRTRRALEPDEFSYLIAAAASGLLPLQGEVSGLDRAMLYVLAAWPGYRRRELASVTGPGRLAGDSSSRSGLQQATTTRSRSPPPGGRRETEGVIRGQNADRPRKAVVPTAVRGRRPPPHVEDDVDGPRRCQGGLDERGGDSRGASRARAVRTNCPTWMKRGSGRGLPQQPPHLHLESGQGRRAAQGCPGAGAAQRHQPDDADLLPCRDGRSRNGRGNLARAASHQQNRW